MIGVLNIIIDSVHQEEERKKAEEEAKRKEEEAKRQQTMPPQGQLSPRKCSRYCFHLAMQ